MTKHTATPWRKIAWGETIAIDSMADDRILVVAHINTKGNSNSGIPSSQDNANAAFIVKACNSYEALIGAIKYGLFVHNPDAAFMNEWKERLQEAIEIAGEA